MEKCILAQHRQESDVCMKLISSQAEKKQLPRYLYYLLYSQQNRLPSWFLMKSMLT